MVNLQIIQTVFVLLVALVCSMCMAQSVDQSELDRFQAVRERRAPNQMRNMMRIGRRSDPLMARAQQKMFDYNNQNNEVDYSHLFRPNGFF